MSIPKIADFHKFCNALSKISCAARCHCTYTVGCVPHF